MADPLDEIRRDLFHAEGDKVCTGRLIRRHVPALLNEVERLQARHEDDVSRLMRAGMEFARLQAALADVAARRCLCAPGHRTHGGPCCGVAGGTYVTCTARAALDRTEGRQ